MNALAPLFDNIIDFPAVTQEKSNEWYTPARYIEAAREVMGGIDLDPASCALANRTVKAKRYYTQAENGLTKPWYGRVWLNPPYCKTENKSSIGLFTKRLIAEYEMGNVTQAILLATMKSDTPWFVSLWQWPICFADHRLHFYKPNNDDILFKDSRTSHALGTIFVYLGPNEQKFIDVFSQFGRIARAIDTPRQAVVPLSLWEGSEP